MRFIQTASAILALAALTACASAEADRLSPGAEFSAGGLSAAYEPAFAAAFDDADEARAVWRSHGGLALSQVEPLVYPPVPAETFVARAAARVEALRAAHPELTTVELSYAALDGLHPAEALAPDAPFAVMAGNDDLPFLVPARQTRERDVHVSAGAIGGADAIFLPTLYQGVSDDVRRLADARSGPLVIDLSGDKGGRLDELQAIGGLFVPASTVLFTIDVAGGADEVYAAAGDATASETGPVLVLIDEETALGALMFAAALSDAGAAEIAGAAADPVLDATYVIEPVRTCPLWSLSCGAEKYVEEAIAVRVPYGVARRADGTPLSEGLAVDRPVDPRDPAALDAAVAAWAESAG